VRIDYLALVQELAVIGQANGFLDRGPGEERTREIGRELEAYGGIEEMRTAHAHVSAYLTDPAGPRELERAWDGIGSWMG
jgi:hypothetical protein